MEKNENGFITQNRRVNSADSENKGSANEIRLNCRGEKPGEATEAQMMCSDKQLAMVYSPTQCFRMLYSVEDALSHGTLFEELYKPLEEC